MIRALCLLSALLVILAGANPLFGQEAVYIVRHAERADQSADSPLSSAGVARARRLGEMLKAAGVTRVFTSELRRTIDTAAPLAESTQLRAEQVPANDTPGLAAKLSVMGANDRALVVGHSNTVPLLLKALHVDTPVTIAETEYDNLFVVVPQHNGSATLLRLKY